MNRSTRRTLLTEFKILSTNRSCLPISETEYAKIWSASQTSQGKLECCSSVCSTGMAISSRTMTSTKYSLNMGKCKKSSFLKKRRCERPSSNSQHLNPRSWLRITSTTRSSSMTRQSLTFIILSWRTSVFTTTTPAEWTILSSTEKNRPRKRVAFPKSRSIPTKNIFKTISMTRSSLLMIPRLIRLKTVWLIARWPCSKCP